MASSTIIPTRMELTRLKKKLVTARKGHKLLKDKRDELMRQFLIMVRENKELREQVEAGIAEANRGFALARSSMSDEAVRVAFMAPKQRVSLDVSYKNIMSVNVPEYTFETRTSDAADMFSYGFAFTRPTWMTRCSSCRTSSRRCSSLPRPRRAVSLWRRRSRRQGGASTRWSMS